MTTRSAVSFALILSAAATVTCGGDRPPTAPSEVQIQAPPPPPGQTYTLSGVVRDYSGRLLGGVTVSLDGPVSGQPTRSMTTDGGGRYAFSDTGGSVQVQASREGLYDDRRKLNVTRDTVQDLELTTPLAIDAGGSVTADIHRGPLSTACASFLASNLESCRPITVRVNRSGTLLARLEWSGPSALALTQMGQVAPNVDIPIYGPTVCCDPGITLRLTVADGSRTHLLVRLRGAGVDNLRFTLSTTWE